MHPKWIKYTFNTLICLILAISWLPLPIHKTVSAIEVYFDDPEATTYRQIEINGTYHFNWFREDTFKGQISIQGFAVTQEKMLGLSVFRDQSGTLYYDSQIIDETFIDHDFGQTRTRYLYFGPAFASFYLNDLLIVPTEKMIENQSLEPVDANRDKFITNSDNINYKHWLVVGVNTRQEAIKKIQHYYPIITTDYGIKELK